MGVEYLRRLETYLSDDSSSIDYVSMQEWTGGNYPPSGAFIRSYYQEAEQLPCTPYGISNFEQYEREIQGVTTALLIAIDWTFQVLKNYVLPDAKACFTMCTETSEINALGIVASTACSQIPHLLQELVQNWPMLCWVLYIYTDTWPHSYNFWKFIFGMLVIGRLGC
jgi:hypothetical protein